MASVVSDDEVVPFSLEYFVETIIGGRARFDIDGCRVDVILNSLNSDEVVILVYATEIFEGFDDVSMINFDVSKPFVVAAVEDVIVVVVVDVDVVEVVTSLAVVIDVLVVDVVVLVVVVDVVVVVVGSSVVVVVVVLNVVVFFGFLVGRVGRFGFFGRLAFGRLAFGRLAFGRFGFLGRF